MTTSAVPVVCAVGTLDRDAVEELHGTLLTYLHHCATSVVICDLSHSLIYDPAPVTRLLTDVGARAARGCGRLLVLPGPGLPRRPRPPSSTGAAEAAYALLDDVDSGLRMTGDPELERDDRHVRRILDRTLRHALRELRSQPPYDTLDPATCQALRWRLADAARAGVDTGPRLLAVAACVRVALASLSAGQYQDAYFALLTADDHLAGRIELLSPDPPRADVRPEPRKRPTGDPAAGGKGEGLAPDAAASTPTAAVAPSTSPPVVVVRQPHKGSVAAPAGRG